MIVAVSLFSLMITGIRTNLGLCSSLTHGTTQHEAKPTQEAKEKGNKRLTYSLFRTG